MIWMPLKGCDSGCLTLDVRNQGLADVLTGHREVQTHLGNL